MMLENLVPFSRTEIDNFEEIAAVYAIINKNNDIYYIGETIHLKTRLTR